MTWNWQCLIFLAVFLYTTSAELCEMYTVEEGTRIESMNYPNDYPRNVKQCWTFRASSLTETINIHFIAFKTESYDPVNIYDGSSSKDTLITTLSGSLTPGSNNFQSTGQYMTVTFTSDYSVEYKGFEACVFITSAAPFYCSSDHLSKHAIIGVFVVVPVIALILLGVLIWLSVLFCCKKSSQNRVYPTSNQTRARRPQVGPNQHEMPPPYSQPMFPLEGQAFPLRGQLPSLGQPTPSAQRQLPPPGVQLPQLMVHYPPPTVPLPPYPGPPQPQPTTYLQHPVQHSGPASDSSALHQQQIPSHLASPPPAPEGLYRNTSNPEPPPPPPPPPRVA